MDVSPPVDRIAQVLGWAMLALFAYLVFLVVEPFLMPLGWAAVLAILSYRLHVRLAGRIGRTWSALLTTVAVAVVLVVPALLVLSALVTEAMEAAAAVQRAVVILVGLLGGMAVFGALGLVLGPILLATALALLSAYVETPSRDIWRA